MPQAGLCGQEYVKALANSACKRRSLKLPSVLVRPNATLSSACSSLRIFIRQIYTGQRSRATYRLLFKSCSKRWRVLTRSCALQCTAALDTTHAYPNLDCISRACLRAYLSHNLLGRSLKKANHRTNKQGCVLCWCVQFGTQQMQIRGRLSFPRNGTG